MRADRVALSQHQRVDAHLARRDIDVRLRRRARPATMYPQTQTVMGAQMRAVVFEQYGEPAEVREVPDPQPACWVAIISGDAMVTPERWLASVIADRQVLAVCVGEQTSAHGSPGDWVCFFLPNKGIVGHAQLAYVVEDGARVVRHGEKFGRVYRLAHLTLYEQPVVQALRAARPFAVPSAAAPFAGSSLTPIARQDFMALTTPAAAEHHAPPA